MSQGDEKVVVGRFGAPHGVRGDVKLQSFTEYSEDLFNYGSLFVSKARQWQAVEIEKANFTGKHFVVRVKGVNDRDAAALLTNKEVAVLRSALPEAEGDDVYWHDLIGLEVISHFDGAEHCLGIVDHVFETGANDVVAVKPAAQSLDDRERLLPYIDSVITEVDTNNKRLSVIWDPEF